MMMKCKSYVFSQPENYEMKETKKKQKTIKRSNEGCFRTVVRCPRCKAKWGMPLSGLPDYCYNIFMQALKSYCCTECLLEFGCMSAINLCPHCNKQFDYDPNDYHRHVTCGNDKCTKTFGFFEFKISTRYEKDLRVELKEAQINMLKKREALQARAKRGSRKSNETENLAIQEELFLRKLIDECPRCGEIPEDGSYESLSHHLQNCNDSNKHSEYAKRKRELEEEKNAKQGKITKQEDMQTMKAWEYLGSEQSQLYLLSAAALRKKCEEVNISTTGLQKNDMIANLAAQNQNCNLLTNGSKQQNQKIQFDRESLPDNLQSLSVSQLLSICACHGYKPKSKTKNGIITEIENECNTANEDVLLLENNTEEKHVVLQDSSDSDIESDEDFVYEE